MSDEIQSPPQAPPPMAAYPRAGQAMGVYGTSEKLERLYRGYHGLSYTFLFMFLTYVLLIVSMILLSDKNLTVLGILAGILCVASFIAIFYFSARSGKDIAFGSGWSDGTGLALGFVTPFVGIIMIIVMQYLAINEMKNYGIRTGAFSGIKKKAVEAAIAELKAYESGSSAVPTT